MGSLCLSRIARRRAEEERGDMLFVPSDDEVGGLQSAIRSERSEQSTRIARRRAEEERGDMLFVPE
jgi:hypothetical protein